MGIYRIQEYLDKVVVSFMERLKASGLYLKYELILMIVIQIS